MSFKAATADEARVARTARVDKPYMVVMCVCGDIDGLVVFVFDGLVTNGVRKEDKCLRLE